MESRQAGLFETLDLGNALKERGIMLAERNANAEHSGWSDKAFHLLCEFIKFTPRFRAEEARAYATEKGLEDPKSKRAFGAIILRAARAGLIKKTGHESVTNPKAHKAFAAVWERKK
jgi:hypothetical protein